EASAAEAEWEIALQRCKQRWHKIAPDFPEAVRRFKHESVCLHDAQILDMARQGETFVMVLRRGRPQNDLILLTFVVDGEVEIDTHALPPDGPGGQYYWLYEEFDLDRGKNCSFEVL